MVSVAKKKPDREQLPAGASLCEHCTAKCCQYFALPIDTPTTRKDFEFIRWFLLHERAAIFTEDDDWYLLVYARCKNLQPDNRCANYEMRPQVCRDYATENCEYEDEWTYERYFETPEQVEEYAEAVLPKKPGEGIRSPRPAIAPVHG
jgi:Fe-S-cluster containining protein